MKFIKYSSIEYTDKQKILDAIREQWLDKWEFVVEEKVHWSNFSVWYDGDVVKYAKRTCFLEDSDQYYDIDTFLKLRQEQLENCVKYVYNDKKAEYVVLYINQLLIENLNWIQILLQKLSFLN